MSVAIRGNVAMRGRVFAGDSFSILGLSPALWLSDTGSDAGTWPDISGNNRHATQSDAAEQPAIVAGGLNGRQIRRFDGTNDVLSGTRVLTTSNFSCFVVAKGAPQQNKLIIGQRSVSAQTGRTQLICTEDVTSPYNTHRLFFNNGTSYSARSTTLALSETVAKLLYSQSDGSGNSSVRVNGGPPEGVITGTSWTPENTQYIIGALSESLNQFAGDIAEILVFPTALSTADRQAVEAYLNAKWAIY